MYLKLVRQMVFASFIPLARKETSSSRSKLLGCVWRRYGSGNGSCAGPCRGDGLQRLARDHPRADRGGKGFCLERTKRYIFPLLDVARAPVVENHEAEDHRFGLRLGQHLAHRRGCPPDPPHFELEIEPLAWPKTRRVRRRRLQLPARPPHLRARNNDG